MADYNDIKNDAKTRMEKSLESLKSDFGGLRAGRAHASLLDGILVEAYGSMTPLSQVGTISVPDARTLSLIRIPIPPLSEERRKELVKIAGKYAEQGKVAVRNVRRDALDGIKKLKKDNEISEDEEKRYENEIQKLTDETIKKMDEAFAVKEKDIMQV